VRVRPLIVAVMLLVAVYLPAFLIVSTLVLTSPAFASAVESDPWLAVPVIMSVTLASSVLIILRAGSEDLGKYGMMVPDWSSIRGPLVVGILFGAAVNLAGAAFWGDSGFLGEPPLFLGILLFWVGAPIQEELIFRGLFQGYLSINLGAVLGIASYRVPVQILLGALAFSLVHVGIVSAGAEFGLVLFTVFGAFVLGIIAGHYRCRDGGLAGPILVHALFNITGTLAAIL